MVCLSLFLSNIFRTIVTTTNTFSGNVARQCYRTWRKRGWCVLEFFASYLSRDKRHPCLLITSSEGIPEWIPQGESLKLSLGYSNFTCCERNHNFDGTVVVCDRITVRFYYRAYIYMTHTHTLFTHSGTLYRGKVVEIEGILYVQ